MARESTGGPRARIRALIGQRGRTIAHAGMWSLIAKMCAAANLLVSVPFVLRALGQEQFGAWATLVSLVVFAGFLDFGIGNGAMNLVASAHARSSPRELTTILRESRRVLLTIAVLLAIATLLALPLVEWHRLLGMPASMAASSRSAVAVVLFSIVLAVPLNLAHRIRLGMGHGDRTFRWQAVGQIAALAAVIILSGTDASLTALTAAAVATPLLASLGNTLALRRDPGLAALPPGTATSTAESHAIRRRIRNEGGLFFFLQLAAALAFSADLPLISALRGAEDAGTYAIVQRLFSLIPISLALVWAPLWPVYRQALASGAHGWIVRTLRRSLAMAVVFSAICAVVLALGFDVIVGAWVDQPLLVSGVLLAGFVLWSITEAAGTAIATFLNAASVMRFQLITACCFAAICFAGKAWVIAHYGITWIPWVTFTTYLLTSVLPFIVFGRRILSDALGREY